MKEIIYNLILAFIGLFVIYIIFYNYLGLNNQQEPFEVDDEKNPIPYDPIDAVDPNNPEPDSPPASAASSAITSDTLFEVPLPDGLKLPEEKAIPTSTIEVYSNDVNDNEPTTIFGKINNFLFGGREGFKASDAEVKFLQNNPEPARNPPSYSYHRRRDRHWRHRRDRRRNADRHRRHWDNKVWKVWENSYKKRLEDWKKAKENYIKEWEAKERERKEKELKLKEAKEKARRANIVKPYLKKWEEVRSHLPAITRHLQYANKTITNTHERNRLGRDTGATYRLYHPGHWARKNFPWQKWRDQSWTASAMWHSEQRTPKYGNLYKWYSSRDNLKKTGRLINYRIADKRRRDEEARKTNERKANWTRLFKKGNEKVGQFNKSRKGHMPGAFYINLINVYGLNHPIRNWKNSRVQDAHKLIDDEYDKEMQKRIDAMRKSQMGAINAYNASRRAQEAAQAASSALAKADAAAAAEATKAAAKAARENAAAVSNMSRTLYDQKRRANAFMRNLHRNGWETRRFTGVNRRHDDMLRGAHINKNTMDDLLKLQAGRIAKVESVPMADIKKISLQARKNYDASLTK